MSRGGAFVAAADSHTISTYSISHHVMKSHPGVHACLTCARPSYVNLIARSYHHAAVEGARLCVYSNSWMCAPCANMSMSYALQSKMVKPFRSRIEHADAKCNTLCVFGLYLDKPLSYLRLSEAV